MPWNLVQNGTLNALTNQTLAALMPGDTPVPRFFMTGDGHEHPPFIWTEACGALTAYFQTLIVADRLCLHVEELQTKVDHASVPERLMGLVDRQRVFGWELTVFGALAPAYEACNELEANGNYQPSAATHERAVELDRVIVKAHPLLWELTNPPALFNGLTLSTQYLQYSKRQLTGAIPRNMAVETQYAVMVRDYRRAVMNARITGNPNIGRKIQSAIDRFPESTHLITCGNAHILNNPLQNFVRIPENVTGIVDVC